MVQPTISPTAAADAECAASIAVDSSGQYPMPGADVGRDIVSGSFTQYAYSATPAAGWLFIHFEVTYEERYSWRDVVADASGGDTQTITDIIVSGTRSWTWDAVLNRDRNPCVEDSLHWEYVDEGGETTLVTDYSRTIKSVVAVFARKPLPSGPILCNHSGVLVCDASGSLLWH